MCNWGGARSIESSFYSRKRLRSLHDRKGGAEGHDFGSSGGVLAFLPPSRPIRQGGLGIGCFELG